MKNGAMQSIIVTGDEEREVARGLRNMDDILLDFRNRIRVGERLTEETLQELLKTYGYFPKEAAL